MIIYKTYEEAAEQVDNMLMENHRALQDAQGASKSQEDGIEESEMSSSDDDDDDDEGQDEEIERERGEVEGSEEEVSLLSLIVFIQSYLDNNNNYYYRPKLMKLTKKRETMN